MTEVHRLPIDDPLNVDIPGLGTAKAVVSNNEFQSMSIEWRSMFRTADSIADRVKAMDALNNRAIVVTYRLPYDLVVKINGTEYVGISFDVRMYQGDDLKDAPRIWVTASKRGQHSSYPTDAARAKLQAMAEVCCNHYAQHRQFLRKHYRDAFLEARRTDFRNHIKAVQEQADLLNKVN